MKNYYYNPKSRDLTIFDTETKELLLLERIEGIRVLTSSELDHPTSEPVEKWHNNGYDPESGKSRYGLKKRSGKGMEEYVKKANGYRCSICGKTGHSMRTCDVPKNAPALEVKRLPVEVDLTN